MIAEFLGSPEPWHWWALGALLIAVEIAVPSFFFLWPGLSAACMGLLLWMFPGIDIAVQIILFAVLAVVTTYSWKRFVPDTFVAEAGAETLNHRSAQYIGRHCRTNEDFLNGAGSVSVDDTRWNAETADGSNPPQNAEVKIIGAKGTILIVRPI
jgi:membrane protein implicated in regulation of membrane protease activity